MNTNKKYSGDKILSIILENSVTVQGKYLELPNSHDSSVIKKIFIKTSDKKREFCIRNLSVDFNKPGWESVLREEINDYLEFLLEQARLEFPVWLANNGKYVEKENPSYSLKEIESEWKSMKSLFGAYRMAADCGFYTSKKPFESNIIWVKDVQETK